MYFSAPTDELIIRHVVRETVFEDEDLLLFDQNDIEPLIEQWDCVHRDDRKRFSNNSPPKSSYKVAFSQVRFLFLKTKFSFDVLSSLEQEICYESEIFLYSKISSWSKNILYQEMVTRFKLS